MSLPLSSLGKFLRRPLEISWLSWKVILPPWKVLGPSWALGSTGCCVLCVLWGSLGSCCTASAHHQAHTSFLPPTSTSSAMVSYLCSKVHVVLSLSLPPPHPPLSFNSRKEFRTHLQRARYQITPRHHYMSQCLKPSGWRKTPSDCQHTCVSVSTRLLQPLHWGGGGAGWGVASGFMEESREVPGFILFCCCCFNKL